MMRISIKKYRFAHRKRRRVEKNGEMLEWLKRHAWKACIRLKRIAGSNPALSAKGKERCRSGRSGRTRNAVNG